MTSIVPFDFIKSENARRKTNGLFRQRTAIVESSNCVIKIGDGYFINFSSNDYLGLSQHQDVLQAYVEGLSLYGASSSSSPVVCGYSHAHKALEVRLSELVNQPSVVLFSSGFAANQAICQALCIPEPSADTDVGIVADKLMHASFVESASTMTRCFKRFGHNDMFHADKQLSALHNENKLLVSEGVFSMDGDTAPVKELLKLKQKHDAYLMLDEAHSFGVVGEQGLGFSGSFAYALEGIEDKGEQQIDITMGTFGKAIGTQGAFVAGSEALIDYLVNFGRHYIYSTAPAPAIARATSTALDIMLKGHERRRLHENIEQFRALAVTKGIVLMPSVSAIQPIVVGCADKVMRAKEKLMSLGILVSAIRSPTVPKGTDRLRITLSALHSDKDIDALIDALVIVRDSLGGFDA